MFSEHDAGFIFFTDEKLFTVAAPMNSQNDRVYAPLATKKRDISANNVYCARVPRSASPLWCLLQYPNSAVQILSSLSLEQKSTGSITETCCWCRSCYQRSAALQETCLSSSKTMRQHIVLVTQSSFCEVRHLSSSVLICGQPTVLTSTR